MARRCAACWTTGNVGAAGRIYMDRGVTDARIDQEIGWTQARAECKPADPVVSMA